jgi:hypothetical protein
VWRPDGAYRRPGGEILGEAGLEFEVLDADPRRVKRIKTRRAALPDDVDAAEPAETEEAGEQLPSQTAGALATRGKSR